jgi:hypothetical protein
MDILAWLIGWSLLGVILCELVWEFEVWYWPEIEPELRTLGDAFDWARDHETPGKD